MKKRVLKYICASVIVLAVIISACTKLDEAVYSDIISEKFTPQESDIWRIIGSAYTPMAFPILFGWLGYFDSQEECGDILVVPGRIDGWVDGGIYKQMHQHTWNDAGPGEARNTWTNIYGQGITNTNYAILEVDSVLPIGRNETPEVARAMRDSIIAELRVLRAFYYWILCDEYGNIPIVTDYRDKSLPLQKTRKEVYGFIVSEIKTNMPLLSDVAGGPYYGRFNKWSAQALLARVYLNAIVYINEPRWDSCMIYCDSIIASNKYQLDADFKTPFSTDNDKNSKELIYAIPQGNDYGKMKQGWFMLMNKSLHTQNDATYNIGGDGPWASGGYCAIPQFINTYSKNDKRLKDTWIMGQQYSVSGDSLFCSQDKKNVAMHKPLAYTNTLTTIDLSDEYEGYRIGKYEIAYGSNEQLANDFPVFRYAEILMMKAECLLRTGDADGAAALVTQVRMRCFDNPADATVTGDTLLKGSRYNYGIDTIAAKNPGGGNDIQYGRFLDELGWEFSIEAQRRTQLIRFGVFSTKAWFNHDVDKGDYTGLYPISSTVLQANSNLKQNPGY